MVINFLSESKGISFTLLYLLFKSFLNILNLIPASRKAISVGSPVLEFSSLVASLQRIILSSNNLLSLFCISNFSKDLRVLFTKYFFTVILFSVRVPVLSEHIMLTEPKVSTAASFLTIAFSFIILWTPRARTIATIAGRPSGIAATARLIDVNSISNQSLPWNIEIININKHIKTAPKPKAFPTKANFFWRSVVSFSSSSSIEAILPISVFIPVATTMPHPLP